MRIEDAVAKFSIQLEADGRSSHTRRQYLRHLRTFATWAHDVAPCGDDIEAVDHEVVATFLASLAATGRAGGGRKKASSANCLRSSIRGFCRYLFEAGLTARDHGRLVRRARCAPPPPSGISDDDLGRLLAAAAKATGPEAARDHLFVSLLAATGLRLSSALAIDVEDLDLEGGCIEIRRSKNDAPARVLLSAGIREYLARYIAGRAAGPLFADRTGRRITGRHAQRRLAELGRAAGIGRRVSAHRFRHRFAQKVYAKTRDLGLTQAALHHRSIASTTRYATPDETMLRAAL